MARHRSREHGQVAIIFALAAVAIVAIVGLSLNAGQSFVDQRAVQASADTASEAGASMLASDFQACLANGPNALPYTNGDIYRKIVALAGAAEAASGKETNLPSIAYVNGAYLPTGPIPSSGSASGDCTASDAPSGSPDSAYAWVGPMGVQVDASNSHTTLIPMVTATSATEDASATSAFGVLAQTEPSAAPFVAWYLDCAQSLPGGTYQPLTVGQTVTLVTPHWTHADVACGPNYNPNSSDFKGFLHLAPSPILAGETTTGGGDSCGQWRGNLSVPGTFTIPIIDAISDGGSAYIIDIVGLASVYVQTASCPTITGVVEGTATVEPGTLVCSSVTAPGCGNAPLDISGTATGVILVH